MEVYGPWLADTHGGSFEQSSLRKPNPSLEKSVASLDANTRRQFEEVYAAILSLMGPTTTEQ